MEGGIIAWIRAGLPMEAPAAPTKPPEVEVTRITWSYDLEAAIAQAPFRRKPVVACYVAAWCEACRRFRKRTLTSPMIADLDDRFEWVMVEVDRDVSILRSREILGTPTVDLIDPDGVTRVRISGFMGPERFRDHLEKFEADVKAGPADPKLPYREYEVPQDPVRTEMPDGFRSSGICFWNVGYGPLRLPSLSPFQALRFGFIPRTPSTLAEGNYEFQWTESWANLWAFNSGENLVDFEMLQSSVSLAYGLSDVLQVELGFVQKSRFGGSMDRFIQNFHDWFGLDQGGRDTVPRNDFGLEILGDDGDPLVQLGNDDRGSFTESIVATVQHNLSCGTLAWPAVAYALTVRRELGEQENMKGGEYVDVSGSLALSKRWSDFFIYLGGGFSWFGQESFEGVDLRTTQVSGLLALEWQFADDASLIVQCLVSQGVAESLRNFSDPSWEVTFGGKFEIAPMVVLEVGVIENIVTFDNSPDFGLHSGLMVRF